MAFVKGSSKKRLDALEGALYWRQRNPAFLSGGGHMGNIG